MGSFVPTSNGAPPHVMGALSPYGPPGSGFGAALGAYSRITTLRGMARHTSAR